MYDKVTLIGLGLIASSMGHAMKKAGLANTIVGYSQLRKLVISHWILALLILLQTL
jgi:prephenate dehydrogenase